MGLSEKRVDDASSPSSLEARTEYDGSAPAGYHDTDVFGREEDHGVSE